MTVVNAYVLAAGFPVRADTRLGRLAGMGRVDRHMQGWVAAGAGVKKGVMSLYGLTLLLIFAGGAGGLSESRRLETLATVTLGIGYCWVAADAP